MDDLLKRLERIDALRRDIDTLRLDMDHHGHIETVELAKRVTALEAKKITVPEKRCYQIDKVCGMWCGWLRDGNTWENCEYGRRHPESTMNRLREENAKKPYGKPATAHLTEQEVAAMTKPAPTPPALDVEAELMSFAAWYDRHKVLRPAAALAQYLAARKDKP